MEKKLGGLKVEEKNNDNNNFSGNGNNFLELVPTFQRTLSGESKIIIKPEYSLCKNYYHLLGIMSLNPEMKITRNLLIKLKSLPMHMNTVTNFIRECESKKFITKCRIIEGTTLNNAYFFKKFPDTFEDGQIVNDKRATYYQITNLGLSVYSINEMKREIYIKL